LVLLIYVMKKKYLLLIITLFLRSIIAFSQESAINDSVNSKIKNEADATILYQQQILDSLVKTSIQGELLQATGDRKKTKELESQLGKIQLQDSLRKAELLKRIESLKKTAKGFPIKPFNDTLFLVFAKIASYSTEERATNITNRILKIYKDPFFRPDSLTIIKNEYGTEIVYNRDLVVMLVTDLDALYYNKDHQQLASEYLKIIKTSLVEERKANSFSNWLIRIGLVVLIITGLSLLIFLINRVFRWGNKFITGNGERLLKGFSLHKIKIFTPGNLEKFILRISNLLRILVIILIVYLSLPLLFSIFPETKMWTTTLLEWILSPARIAWKGIIGFLPNLFSIVVIVLIFKYSIRGIKYFVTQIQKEEIQLSGFHADWAEPTFRILKFLLYAFMLVLVFPYLPGSGSPAFQGVSVFIGILFSLGSSSAIANMVAGLVITYMRPFRIGDRVKIGDITGDVMEKTTLVTRIRTIKNEDVTVPNSTVLLSSTTNYSTNTGPKDNGLIVHTTVTIGYDVPWKDMHQALIDAALRTDMILKNPQPFVLQTSLDDFYVSYQINGYTKEANKQAVIYSQLHQNIQDCCNEAGIEIMSPHYRNQRDGGMTTIPAQYLESDYKAPAINVNLVSPSPGSDTKNSRNTK
jgi:small-conductance mechanosensitive channel